MKSRYFFTARAGGVSDPPFDQRNLALHVGDDPAAVLINRAQLASEVGVESDRLYFMNQVHGAEIIEITHHSTHMAIRQCDALYTRTPGIALAVLVADCAPVILLGERTSAVIHVGWRGLFGGIIESALALFEDESFIAHIGPTICGTCYTIGDDLHLLARERGFVTGKDTLDIPQSITELLSAHAGKQLIGAEWNGICTYESDEHFSYRRDNTTGRQAGVVLHGS